MHLTAWLKNGPDDRFAAERALEYGVYAPPVSFYCYDVKLRYSLFLGCAGISPTEILTGVERLRKMFSNFVRKKIGVGAVR